MQQAFFLSSSSFTMIIYAYKINHSELDYSEKKNVHNCSFGDNGYAG